MHAETAAVSAPVRDRFLADHARLEVILEQLYAAFAANDRDEMSRLWSDFDAGLGAHLEAEETHLFPLLLRVCERDARVLAQEHRHIRSRLAELGTMVDLHTVRLETIRDFIDELRAHGQSEDRLLYRWADVQLDEPHRRSLLDALRAHGRKRPA